MNKAIIVSIRNVYISCIERVSKLLASNVYPKTMYDTVNFIKIKKNQSERNANNQTQCKPLLIYKNGNVKKLEAS